MHSEPAVQLVQFTWQIVTGCVYSRCLEGTKKECLIGVFIDTMLPQAISVSDEIWVVATQVWLELLKVCEGKPTRTIRLIPLLSIQGCSAFRVSISLPPYYQTKERLEEKKSFVKLTEI